MTPRDTTPDDELLDLALVAGFDFACRPDCGLCCYAEPAVSAKEWGRLLQIAPDIGRWERSEGQLPSRPRGGACALLERNACRAHSNRPLPCAEFPLSTHLGPRLQVTVVLSCPGVPVDSLAGDWFGRARPPPGPGLTNEIATVARAAASLTPDERRASRLAWGRRLGPHAPSVGSLRAELLGHLPRPTADALADDPIPSESDGLATLPIFFDEEFGRVVLSRTHQGVDVLSVREGGGIERRLASFPAPDHLPTLESDGARLLDGYLAYVVERDAFVGAGLAVVAEDRARSLSEVLAEDLEEIAAAVIHRAMIRDWLHGGSGEHLGAPQVAAGMRATDADYLDRPTVGRWV